MITWLPAAVRNRRLADPRCPEAARGSDSPQIRTAFKKTITAEIAAFDFAKAALFQILMIWAGMFMQRIDPRTAHPSTSSDRFVAYAEALNEAKHALEALMACI